MKCSSISVLVVVMSLALHACDKAPDSPIPPTLKPASPKASLTAPPAKKSAPREALKNQVDPEALMRANAKVERGLELLQKKDPQAARKVFYEAVTLSPTLDTAQLGLAHASFAVGNKRGARAAAEAALLHTNNVLVRTKALNLLRQTPPEAPESWQSPAFYAKYLAYNLLTTPQEKRPVALSVLDAKTLKSTQKALAHREKSIKQMQCEAPVLKGPFTSPKALVDAIGKDQEHKWAKKPKVSSAPQVLLLTLSTEDTSEAFMIMGHRKTWFAVPVARTTHASSGHVHENMKAEVKTLLATHNDVFTMRASAQVRRGQDDQEYGEFYKSEDTWRVLCKWAKQSLLCKRALVQARRTIFATKLGQDSQHAMLVEYGPDDTGSTSEWRTLPNQCAP